MTGTVWRQPDQFGCTPTGIVIFANFAPKRPPSATSKAISFERLRLQPASPASKLPFFTRLSAPSSSALNASTLPTCTRFTSTWSLGMTLPSALFSSSSAGAAGAAFPVERT